MISFSKIVSQKYFPIAIIVVAFLSICAVCLNNIIIYTPDSARYVVWAKSLAFFRGFYDDTNPEPTRYVIHAPLYSVFLAPIARILPYSVVAAKALTSIFGVISLFLFWVWINPKVSRSFAIIGCLLLALNPLMAIYSTQVLSDIPFVASLLLFFVLLESNEVESRGKTTVFTLMTVTAGFLLREVGLTLMLTSVTIFLVKKDYRRSFLYLAIPLVVYFVWLIRNELIVAPIEVPSLRNSQVFLTHYFTPEESGFLEEVKQRFWNNFKVYKDLVGMILFLPQYVTNPYAGVSLDATSIKFAYAYLNYAKLPIVIGSIGVSVVGVVSEWRNSIAAKAGLIFLLFYALPLLLYPINDIRFLLPVLVIMCYFAIIGFSRIAVVAAEMAKPRYVSVFKWVVVVLCSLPNVLWLGNFSLNNIGYSRVYSSRDPSLELTKLPPFFHRPVDLAGRMIASQSDSSAIVGTVWKEAYFWLDGRKVVEINPYTLIDAFDNAIRDYAVKYLLVLTGTSGLRDYEAQMVQSRRFDFTSVGKIGSLEIIEVKDKAPIGTGGRRLQQRIPDSNTGEFRDVQRRLSEGIALLESNPVQAESIFKDIWNTRGSFGTVVFYTAIAKELNDSLTQASNWFKRFGSLPQAGGLLTQAWYHQEIIARLREALKEADSTKRAQKFNVVAVNYWELGFRTRAIQMLGRSLKSDPNFFPSIILSALYSLQVGDISASRKFLTRAENYEPSNELVKGLSSVFHHLDTLGHLVSLRVKEQQRIGIAQDYEHMGLRESAIDELKDVLRENPNQINALHSLADIYILKRRFSPARKVLLRLLELNQNDTSASHKLEALRSPW